MLKLARVMWITILAVVIAFGVIDREAYAEDYEPVKSLIDKYQSGESANKKEAIRKLRNNEPRTREDMEQLRNAFSKKEWDPILYHAGFDSIEKTSDPSLDEGLINILQDEKSIMDKAGKKDFGGRTEQEIKFRRANVMLIVQKLGKLKSTKATSILKEYLRLPEFQYSVSEAMGKIGDKSASEEIREKAAKDANINYGGLGLNEATNVIHDLQDKSKKDKWKKYTQQLKHIRNHEMKPYLKKLFNHEDEDVRREAAVAFTNMTAKNDANDLIEMTKHQDWSIRSRAIYAMMILRNEPFDEALINVLVNDRDESPRATAARALGYKKVQKAVFYLEKALLDSELRVRREAFISLYVLTRKKYDFQGRNKDIDSEAEYQHMRPSLY